MSREGMSSVINAAIVLTGDKFKLLFEIIVSSHRDCSLIIRVVQLMAECLLCVNRIEVSTLSASHLCFLYVADQGNARYKA